jgi:NADPH:quinone reductase-like Zn-dependent oxidoreductase
MSTISIAILTTPDATSNGRCLVWPLLAARKVSPVIDSTFSLAEAAKAQERMESSQHIGKIVLTVA